MFNLPPDDYTLTITGYDVEDAALWSSVCVGLELRRFDTLFECDIEAN